MLWYAQHKQRPTFLNFQGCVGIRCECSGAPLHLAASCVFRQGFGAKMLELVYVVSVNVLLRVVGPGERCAALSPLRLRRGKDHSTRCAETFRREVNVFTFFKTGRTNFRKVTDFTIKSYAQLHIPTFLGSTVKDAG